MLAVASVPPVYTASLPYRWWNLVYFCCTRKARPWCVLKPFIERRPAYFTSHLRCSQRATHIKWRSCSNFYEGMHLDACNCVWQLTGDLLFVLSIQVALLACVRIGSLAQLAFSFCKRSLLASHRGLMISLAMWSHQRLSFGLKSLSRYLTVTWFSAKNEVILGLLSLSYSTASCSN